MLTAELFISRGQHLVQQASESGLLCVGTDECCPSLSLALTSVCLDLSLLSCVSNLSSQAICCPYRTFFIFVFAFVRTFLGLPLYNHSSASELSPLKAKSVAIWCHNAVFVPLC